MLRLFSFLVAVTLGEDIVHLTDDDFEHLTQASTGHTTGDWFVMFHATWCGHCKAAIPKWQEFAELKKGLINVAAVNAPDCPNTADRFSVRGYPSFVFLKGGKMYDYNGGRDVSSWDTFALSGYASEEAKEVPGPLTWFSKFIRDLEGDFEEIIMRRLAATGIILAFGILFGIMLSMCFCICCGGGGNDNKVRSKED